MTARRTLGNGPPDLHGIRASQADLLDSLPEIRLPDLDELRARGVLGAPTATPPARRRPLGAGTRQEGHLGSEDLGVIAAEHPGEA
ncbi:hypothetical protein ACWCQZ_38290 [Streptomyces sp. NPDC002285]